MNKFVLAVAAVLVGGVVGYMVALNSMPIKVNETSSNPDEPAVLFWRNPMNPIITSPVFMQDEMGMDYIPVYADGAAVNEVLGTVSIDPVTVQNIGVRTANAEQRELSRQLMALGHVDFNEEQLARMHPKISGWIERLRVEETGVAVKQDTILMEVYSPELVAAQQEYLVALSNWERAKNATAKRVLQSARERLELFDVPVHQIHELEKTRKPKKQLHIHSPFEGRVMNIGVRDGQYVTPADELYLIANLDRIWVYVDVYEDDLPWIKVGDKAQLEVRAAPGKQFHGTVAFIHPMQDRKTRTVRVRLDVDNPDLVLKPGMFANVVLHVDPRPEAIVVPSEAIIRSGEREQLFVARGQGKFEPREVVLGISAAGYTQVLSGVNVGESVVVSSQFLIDSESKLREATAKMMAGVENMPMDHGAHDMSDMDMEGMDMSDMDMDDMEMTHE